MTTKSKAAEPGFESIMISRQPIFDAKMGVWGYELNYPPVGDKDHPYVDPLIAASSLFADGLAMALKGLPPDKKVLIVPLRGMITDHTVFSLPPERCVVGIPRHVPPTADMLDVCGQLARVGYRLLLDAGLARTELEPFLDVVHMVRVRVGGAAKDKVAECAARVIPRGADLVAAGLPDRASVDFARGLGFAYFQGVFFGKPEVVPGRKVPTSNLAKLRLLQALQAEQAEVGDLADIVSSDPSLSYRLLRFVNSSAFSLQVKVNSIPQAINLIGFGPLRKWIAVLLLSDLDTEPRGQELAYIALQRARFLEQIAPKQTVLLYSADVLFLVGLLSKMDAMLNQDMADVVEDLPVHDAIKEAYCGESNEVGGMLDMLDAAEHGDWDKVYALLKEYGVDSGFASRKYMEASTWAHEVLDQAS